MSEMKKKDEKMICGNEPVVLDPPVVDGSDPSCGNEPFKGKKPIIRDPEDWCGGKKPGLSKPKPKPPIDPRVGGKLKDKT